jgi:hypothetical protein
VSVEYDITVQADRDYYLPISLVTDQNNPANLTGYIVTMCVKKTINDPDASALFKSAPSWTNLPFGKFTFHVPRATNNAWWIPGSGQITNTIVYDVAVQDIATPTPNWVTLVTGNVTVMGPISRSIP